MEAHVENNFGDGKKEIFVIDGTNVCFWWSQAYNGNGHRKVSVRPLLVLLSEIIEHGDDFYCIFDASIIGHFHKHRKYGEADIIELLIYRDPKHFFRVTGLSFADSAILHNAEIFNRRIITNDKYEDYQDRISWLNERHAERLIQGNYQPSGILTIEKLSYGFMRVDQNIKTRDLFQRLKNCLIEEFDWKSLQPNKISSAQVPVLQTARGTVEITAEVMRREEPPIAEETVIKQEGTNSRKPKVATSKSEVVKKKSSQKKKKESKAKSITKKKKPTTRKRRSPQRKKNIFERFIEKIKTI